MHPAKRHVAPLAFSLLFFVFTVNCGFAQQDWKRATIAELDSRFKQSDRPAEKREIRARQNWLAKWKPGDMKSHPTFDPTLREKRVEPLLPGEAAAFFRKLNSNPDTAVTYQVLKELTDKSIDNPALLQFFLHYLDDKPSTRKKHLDEIESLSARLIRLLQKADIDSESALIRQFTRYRRARALAYRELPDVLASRQVKDRAALGEKIETAYREVVEDAGEGRTEFVLLEIRMHRRNRDFGIALELLEKFQGSIRQKWYLKKRRDLLKELGWKIPYREAAKIYATEFPEAVALEQSR